MSPQATTKDAVKRMGGHEWQKTQGQVRASGGWQHSFSIYLPDSSNCRALQGPSGWF